MKLTSVEINCRTYEVEVDAYGTFRSQHGNEWHSASSLDSLKNLLRAKARKTKVKIEVVYTDADTLLCHTVTGKHATTGNWTVTGEGNVNQLRTLPYNALRPLTNEEHAKLKALRETARAAARAEEEYAAKFRYVPSLRDICEKALHAASESMKAAETKVEIKEEV